MPTSLNRKMTPGMIRKTAIKAPEKQRRHPENCAITVVDIDSIDVDRRH